MRRGEAQRPALIVGDRVAGGHGIPCITHGLRHERFGGANVAFGQRDLGLDRSPFGQRSAAALRSFLGRQHHHLIDRPARQPERHRGHSEGQHAEEREPVQRTVLARLIDVRLDPASFGHDGLADLVIGAPGALQPADMPRVEQLDVGSLEQDKRREQAVFTAFRGSALVYQKATPTNPCAVPGSRAPGPPSSDPQPAALERRRATRPERRTRR